MRRIAATSLFLLLTLAFASASFAQKAKKLRVEWLAEDVASIKLIPKLMPIESRTMEDIRAVFGKNIGDDEKNLGFGAGRFTFSKGSGYTSLYVDAFTLNGSIEYYEIGIRGDSEDWPRIRGDIIKAWLENGGPEFEENSEGLAYRKMLDAGFQAYKNVVAAELGQMKAVDVPANLKDYYEVLIAPLSDLMIGFGGCGYGGGVPYGRQAIDALVKAKRTDLIENVLRGYNPGGRVYAALALLEMKKQGARLSSDTQSAINRIKSLDIELETCSGCIVTPKTAREILEGPPF